MGGWGVLRCVLTTSTDVLTTSETLCLSSAAVPGLPSPRVNLLVSGCAGVAIAAHHFASMTVQSTGCISRVQRKIITGLSVSPIPTSARHEFRAGSCCVVAVDSLPPLGLILFALKSQHVLPYFGSRSSSIGFIVDITRYPLEECFIGRPAPDRRCTIWSPPRRTPPLTGFKARPLLCACELAGPGLWTVSSSAMND